MTVTTSPRRLKLALFGLGRLGAIRARILAYQQPLIDFVAACDTKPGAAEWAATNLPPSVRFYDDPEDCMRHSGAEAILISTATATHAPLICLGLDLGLVSFAFLGALGDGGLTSASMLCVRSRLRWTFWPLRKSSRKQNQILS